VGVATLVITDGSTIVDLLATGYGFHLADWPQAITGYKGGGTIQDSPLADGRRLVDKKFVDGIETFTLRANATNQDALADDMQDLLRLLEQATDYWSGWYDTPVYLEVKWNNETNTRYAIIKNYQVGALPNPFGPPFLQANCEALYDEFTLVIERGPWLSNVPGEETATAASASESYDGRTLGNVDSAGTVTPVTTKDVYVANKNNIANLTDIYNYDASLATFSSNLMDAALPFTLFPAGPAIDDAVYFGIDTSVSNSGPFSNLVFDIGTAANYNASLVWEYWNGSAWATVIVIMITSDATTQSASTYFQTALVTSVSWSQPTNWATTSINGITGYWLRVRDFDGGGWTTRPTQQNRDIYSAVWPYARVGSDQVGGDLPALLRLRYTERNADLNVLASRIAASRLIVALRSESRGADFTPFLNCSDEQNVFGITLTAKTNTVVGNDLTTPTGRRYTYSPVGAEAMATRLIIGIFGGATALADQYVGQFRLFLRARQESGAAGDIEIRIGLDLIGTGNTDNIIFYTPTLALTNTGQPELLDFGQITLPGVPLAPADSGDFPSFFLRIQASATSATPSLRFYDLILMPVDEWSGEFLAPAETGAYSLDDETSLDIDSVLNPHVPIRTFIRSDIGLATDLIAPWRTIDNGPAILQANVNQRLWFLPARKLNNAWLADFEALAHIQITRNQRYFSARGDR
jgi:hypothetical protein